jgi:hypothetical protein
VEERTRPQAALPVEADDDFDDDLDRDDEGDEDELEDAALDDPDPFDEDEESWEPPVEPLAAGESELVEDEPSADPVALLLIRESLR